MSANLDYWVEGVTCESEVWEEAFSQFETPEQETRKFTSRLKRFGALDWPKSARVVELFCGQGNGLVALSGLGFQSLEGVDLSPGLLGKYQGPPAKLYVGDCRDMQIESNSVDYIVVHAGMHHLPVLPDDLDAVFSEIHRVLKPGGTFVFSEPWLTPFLQIVHTVTSIPLVRKVWRKGNAFATLRELESTTYEKWIASPDMILGLLDKHFQTQICKIAFGKILYNGTKRKD